MKKTFFLTLTMSVFLCFNILAQNIKVQGTVTSKSDGMPLPGVNVIIAGTTQGTITDFDGKYIIDVSSPDVELQFSYIGYNTINIKVGGQTTINVVLEEETKELDEVVVIGYGVQKKKLNTGATVNLGGDDIQSLNTSSAMEALKGLSPGVYITQNNGQPGSGSKVYIRGIGTIGNYKPLYVVDGVAMDDIDYLSPSDIESYDVLKDASTAAIYGSRAANGIIMVTTKSAKPGEKMSVTYDNYFGVQNVAKNPNLLNAKQYAEIINEGRVNAGQAEFDFSTMVPNWDKIESGELLGTNWFNEIVDTNAMVQSHSLSIKGANDISKFSMGASYLNQQGILGKQVNNDYKRITLRLKSDHILLKKSGKDIITIGENITYTNEVNPTIRTGNIYWNDVHNMMVTSPLLPMWAEDETDVAYPYHYAIGWNSQEGNPIAGMENYGKYRYNNNNTIVASSYLELQPIKNLIIRSSFAVNNWYGSWRAWTPTYQLSDISVATQDQVDQSMYAGYTWTAENRISYKYSINQVHNIDLMFGNEVIRNARSLELSGHNENSIFNDPEYAYLNNVNIIDPSYTRLRGKDAYGWAMLSYLGRLIYDYNEKYIFTFNFRADGSSKFDKGHKWGSFPSVSAGWVVSSEPFMDNMKNLISFLRLRGSWGQNGNQDIQDFTYLSTFTYDAYYFFGSDKITPTIGAYPARVPNPEVSWETSEQIDLGTDIYFLDNKLTFVFDWYKKNTRDWLIQAPASATDGTAAPTINAGDILNTGVEIMLRYNNRISEFKYNITATMAHNKNEVIDIPNEEGIIHGPSSVISQGTVEMFRAQEGYPIGYFWGFETDGVFQNQAEVDAYVNDSGQAILSNVVPGDLRFVDQNGDGEITDSDKVMIGNPHPDYVIGLQLNLEYKGFSIQFTGNGQFGMQVAKSYRSFADSPRHNYTADIYEQRWTGEGSTDKYPRLFYGTHRNYQWVSDLYIEDADFFRISNITIGYNLNQLFKGIPFAETKIYISGNNLHVFTNYSGMDPEVGYSPTDDSNPENDYKWGSGIDLGLYPQARVFMAGLNIKF